MIHTLYKRGYSIRAISKIVALDRRTVSKRLKNLEFIKQCVLQLLIGKKFDRVRIDSAGYQYAINQVQEDIWEQLEKSKIEIVVNLILRV